MRMGGLWAAGATIGAAALLVYGGASLGRVWSMHQEAARLERQIRTLHAEGDDLRQDIDRLRSDPASIEAAAREVLGLVKPDEKVLKLPASSASRPGALPPGAR